MFKVTIDEKTGIVTIQCSIAEYESEKMRIIASSHGFQQIPIVYKGKPEILMVSLNAGFRKAKK